MGPALTVLLIAASTALAAQSAAPPAKHQSAPDGSTVTVTGCLTKGEPAGLFTPAAKKRKTDARKQRVA
jgi:hypothetical protein